MSEVREVGAVWLKGKVHDFVGPEIAAMELGLIPLRVEHLRETFVDGSMVVLDRDRSRCHVMNLSGAAVWTAIDNRRSVQEIIDLLVAENALQRAEAESIVGVALHGYIDADLVELVDTVDDAADGAGSAVSASDATVAFDDRRAKWQPTIERCLAGRPGATILGPLAFGDVAVTIGTDIPELASYLGNRLAQMHVPNGWVSGDNDQSVWIVNHGLDDSGSCSIYVNGRRNMRGIDRSRAVEQLLHVLNLAAISNTRESILLHAGAVELKGRVVVIAGVSGQGKSTLTAALVRSGFSYVTDELVIIDPSTRFVRPYLKPLDLGAESLKMLDLDPDDEFAIDKKHVVPSEVGAVSTGGRVALIVILDPDAGEMDEIESLGPVDALTTMLPNVFAETHDSPDSLDQLADLCASVPVIRMARRPIAENVETIRASAH